MVEYGREFQARSADELDLLLDGSRPLPRC
ncbi:hypothetical protein FHS78_003498 [Parvibaculum indicum]|nr:hypothetical protein [Parvibaculum indicum]